MAIEPLGYTDRSQPISALRQAEAAAVETAPDPARLAAAAGASALAGLSPFAAEARRTSELAAAAKAASVALVTQPVPVPPTEPNATTVERIEPVETPLRREPDDAADAYRSTAEAQDDPAPGTAPGRSLSRVA
ncbi:hypothetical protein [Methylopila sp. M107]|uniref:hypothetical protein n=1 Tax=Methylopila sp. M107 TaxID=1101190 RepID=UPI000363E8B3|nr:hypothetical protein [Methylopila sp. M107]